MPTPFTHLVYAHRLLNDPALPAQARDRLAEQLPAFYLGSVAADGHLVSHLKREDTHFYAHDRPMEDHLWRVMLSRHPELSSPADAAQHAFVAGYVAHLTMDEIWSLKMVYPHFVDREWASRGKRFLMLNVLLTNMDERDYALIDRSIPPALLNARANAWLPFIQDAALDAWGALIQRQIAEGGRSETLDIIAPRVMMTVDSLRALLDAADQLEIDLWANIPRELLREVETQMYDAALKDLIKYVSGDLSR